MQAACGRPLKVWEEPGDAHSFLEAEKRMIKKWHATCVVIILKQPQVLKLAHRQASMVAFKSVSVRDGQAFFMSDQLLLDGIQMKHVVVNHLLSSGSGSNSVISGYAFTNELLQSRGSMTFSLHISILQMQGVLI